MTSERTTHSRELSCDSYTGAAGRRCLTELTTSKRNTIWCRTLFCHPGCRVILSCSLSQKWNFTSFCHQTQWQEPAFRCYSVLFFLFYFQIMLCTRHNIEIQAKIATVELCLLRFSFSGFRLPERNVCSVHDAVRCESWSIIFTNFDIHNTIYDSSVSVCLLERWLIAFDLSVHYFPNGINNEKSIRSPVSRTVGYFLPFGTK